MPHHNLRSWMARTVAFSESDTNALSIVVEELDNLSQAQHARYLLHAKRPTRWVCDAWHQVRRDVQKITLEDLRRELRARMKAMWLATSLFVDADEETDSDACSGMYSSDKGWEARNGVPMD